MPYLSEQLKIAGTPYDLRRKLTDDQIRAVSILSEQGYSQRRLANMFGCSKGTIENILCPQKHGSQKKRPTKYWSEAKKRYRQRKQQLYQNGVIGDAVKE